MEYPLVTLEFLLKRCNMLVSYHQHCQPDTKSKLLILLATDCS